MSSKTPYQFFYEEEIRTHKQRSGKVFNDIQKDIGNKWNSMSLKEKQPYLTKKKEFEEQIKREQEVLKEFTKRNSIASGNQVSAAIGKNTRSQIAAALAIPADNSSKLGTNKSNNTVAMVTASLESQKKAKFAKEDLQKEQSEVSKKVFSTAIARKSENTQPNQQDGQPINIKETNHKVYLEFYEKQYQKYQKMFPQRGGKELTQVICKEWKLMKLSHQLKEKKECEKMKATKKKYDVSKKGCIVINGKEISVPKRPLSGYMRFYQKNYDSIKQTQNIVLPNQIASIASISWNKLPEAKKNEYNGPYLEDLAQFQRQKSLFIQKYGFFPSQNQSKSSQKQDEKESQRKQIVTTSINNNKTKGRSAVVKSDESEAVPVKLSGYYLFDKTLRAQMAEKEHNLSSRELSQFIGQHWKKFPAESKKEYEIQQEREFSKQKAAWISKHRRPFPEVEKKLKGAAAISVANKKAEDAKNPKPTTTTAAGPAATQKLNVKRRATEVTTTPAPAAKKPTIEESEARVAQKALRRSQINYEDVESELDDIMECLEREGQDSDSTTLKTREEENFEKFEKNFNNKKFKKSNEPVVAAIAAPKRSVQKQQQPPIKNNLFALLNEPVEIPDFGPSYFY